MIKLPNKGVCKRKQFNKALIIDNFIYMEFMNPKNPGGWYGKGGDEFHRDMTSRKKIFKVVDKHKLSLIYYEDQEGNWIKASKTLLTALQDNWNPHHNTELTAHNIWSWYQKDEIRHIRSMTKDEFAIEYLMEII